MKKGMLSALALAALVTGLLIGVSSSSAKPATADRPAYKHYIACGLTQHSKPAHACALTEKIGAFFKSFKADVKYRACLRSPRGRISCNVAPQEAEQGTLYVNKVTPKGVGRFRVTWFVKGKKVGTSVFRVK